MKENTIEIWKPVVGYEGLYEVSTHGRVRSLPVGRKKGMILKPGKTTKYGHVGVNLYRQCHATVKPRTIHRLVMLAFVENPRGLKEINHIDNDPTNNHIDNLEWVSSSGNSIHCANQGRVGFVRRYKIDEATQALMRKEYFEEKVSYAKLAKRYGICLRQAWVICTKDHRGDPNLKRDYALRELNEQVLECIATEFKPGISVLSLAKKYQVSYRSLCTKLKQRNGALK